MYVFWSKAPIIDYVPSNEVIVVGVVWYSYIINIVITKQSAIVVKFYHPPAHTGESWTSINNSADKNTRR